MDCFQERSFYYFRHGLFGHVVKMCEIGLEKKKTSLILYFYWSLAQGILGKTEEAIKIISHLQKRLDLSLAYDTALYCIELSSRNPSTEKAQILYDKITSEISTSNSLSSYISAQALIFFQYYDLAQQIFSSEKARSHEEKYESFNSGIRTMEVWLDMMNGHPKRAILDFDEIMKHTKKSDILCMYGKAVCHTILGEYLDSIQIYNTLLAKHDFPEFHVEKCRIYFLMKKIELAVNFSEELKSKLFSHMELKILLAFKFILDSQKDQIVSDILDDLVEQIYKFENSNWRFQAKLSLSLSTLCGNRFSIFDRIIKLTTHAFEQSNFNEKCGSILGFHQYLARNYFAALNTIQKVLEKDGSNAFAMETNIRLMIDTGRYLEAKDAIDLYSEIGLDHDFLIETLKSKLNRKMVASNEENFLQLVNSLSFHLRRFMLKHAATSEFFGLESKYENIFDLYIYLRPDAIIESLDELVLYNYSSVYNLDGKYGAEILNIIKPLTTLFVDYSPFNFFYALLLKRNNKLDDSFTYFERALCSMAVFRLPLCLTEVSELLAYREMDSVAVNCIEEASHEDPTLASSPEFALTKAKIIGNVKESIPPILYLIESTQAKTIAKTTDPTESLLLNERKYPFYLYLKFIDLCISVKEFSVASQVICKVINFVSHSCEKAMLMMRQSIILASKGKMEKALFNIHKLQNHQKYLKEATEIEAEVYLKFQNNREKYISCFYSMAMKDKTSENFCLLGKAHQRLKQFEEAIDAYLKALEIDNRNETALTNLSLVYVSAHRFEDAVSLFTRNISIMRTATENSLVFLRLMIQLKKFDEADQCIVNILHIMKEMSPTTISAYLELQGDILTHKNKYIEANKIYNQAFLKIENIVNSDINNAFFEEIKHIASTLLCKIGLNFYSHGEIEKSIDFFNKSLSYNEKNAATVSALFDLYKSRYDIEKCRKVCADYLVIDPDNEAIALLFTSAQYGSFNESISCIRHVLDVHPFYIKSLVRLIEMCARSGKLQLTYHYLKLAKNSNPSFFFAAGLYFQYSGNFDKSLNYLKKACESNKWRLPAKICIISIMSNPNRKYIWCEEGPLSSPENLAECEKIFDSITSSKNNSGVLDNTTGSLIRADLLCCKNTDESVTEAQRIYGSLVKENPRNIAAIVGSTRCLTRFKEFDQAEKMLNFVMSQKPFLENCSYFEEAYLILAHIVEKKKKSVNSQHFVFFALELNMSCKKAWEMSAEINLKNKMYQEAAAAFGHLWELCGHNDPKIGYQYALCSMKAKKYEIALIVCRDVLNLAPEYQNLKQEIQIPSFQNIKS